MACWLFKTEPGCFSFADLQSRPESTEHWDGVRNYQARNYLRDQIKVGDLVLVYHSSIPEPGVVGIARVVRDGYADFTAFDPAAEHFDPASSPDKPVWYMVDVQAVRELPRPVPLALIKEHPLLQGMPLVNRSRLSVQPVTATEWKTILNLGGMEGVEFDALSR
jgi:predicted RNA-binding protein with PUA-like domain